jgi:hypothetical protein
MAEFRPLILLYHYWFTHNSILSMLGGFEPPSRKTSALYIIRMSRKAFFPLGGHFVENSLTRCEPGRSGRRVNAELSSLRYDGGACGLALLYH